MKRDKTDIIHPLLISKGWKPRKGIVKTCPICGVEFYIHPYRVNTRQYCSRVCASKALIKSPIHVCIVCGKEYLTSKSQEKYRGKSFYCSRKCKGIWMAQHQIGKDNPQWKGGISTESHRLRASKIWAEWRNKVFEKDNHTCRDCGKRGGILHPHHIKPFARFPDLRFEVSNGMTLCESCHKRHTAWQKVGGLI